MMYCSINIDFKAGLFYIFILLVFVPMDNKGKDKVEIIF